MIFTINHNKSIELVWDYFTKNEFLEKWIAEEAKVNPKKNGKFFLIINSTTNHILSGCKIIEYQEHHKLVFTWKGPEEYEMMNFHDVLTQVEINFHESKLMIEHIGWRSSEDWQEAKIWHEKEFWSPKIANLIKFLEE
jgi:uncharacterized protein YndB with AHSA1/START domain